MAHWAFEEARRRFESFHAPRGKPLGLAWTGLGFPSEYKPMVEKGFMVSIDTEVPRCLSWYVLTEKGVAEYRRLFPGSESGKHKYRNGSEIVNHI
jgi:hypothetical protein